jgi:hypothetical protein
MVGYYMGIDWCVDCGLERPQINPPRWYMWAIVRWWRFRLDRLDPWLKLQRSYWQPCPDCGRLYNDCDETHDHIPF